MNYEKYEPVVCPICHKIMFNMCIGKDDGKIIMNGICPKCHKHYDMTINKRNNLFKAIPNKIKTLTWSKAS